MTPKNAPTALISWAHRNSEWTDSQADEWIAQVLKLAKILRSNGVDADLDLWNESNPSVDWTRWGQQKVQHSDSVIVVVSTAWKQRWDGSNSPKEGAGAVAEADTLKSLFQTNQEEFQSRVILVMLPGTTNEDIPAGLHRLYRARISTLNEEGVEDLLRAIYRVPVHEKPEIGLSPFTQPKDSVLSHNPTRQEITTARMELDSIQKNNTLIESTNQHGSSESSSLTPAEVLSNNLDTRILSRVFKTWDEETKLFKHLSVEPTRQTVEECLSVAYTSRLISTYGPRVRLYDTYFMVRFLTSESSSEISTLTLRVETLEGKVLRDFRWDNSLDLDELLTQISAWAYTQPAFDGALGYFPSTIFSGLSDLLVMTSEARKGLGFGDRLAFQHVIEIVNNYWVITEEAIFPKDRSDYVIHLTRLDEPDWVSHIRAKKWEGESGIELAIAIAKTFLSERSG